jgi:AAA domain/Bifunctional DNA primase/polymerase, N-terminal
MAGTMERRVNNQATALTLAAVGVHVFVSSGKTPLIPRYNQRDTDITPEDRQAAIEEYEEKHGKKPVHVGATCDQAVVKKMYRRYPDAVTSVACGPSKLVVIDADTKNNGPEKIAALFDEIGQPDTIVITSQSGGKHYVFADPDMKFTNRAGLLKKNYGCDVRGSGGQFVAPGSIREDNKTYGTAEDRAAFARRYNAGSFPQLPTRVVELIGSAGDGVEREDVKPSQEREIIQQLAQGDYDIADAEWAELGEYSVDYLKGINHEFKQLYDNPSSDCSTNRFKITRMVMAQWPQMSPPALASFLSQWEGSGTWTEDKPKSGEYDNRQIAREWAKNQGLERPSDGAALDAIEDDEYSKKFAEERTRDKERAKATALAESKLHYSGDVAFFTPIDEIVEGLFAKGQLCVIYGPSNVGKTFTVLHLGECIADGRKWFGLNTEKSGVLYSFGEGHAGIANRLAAYRKAYSTQSRGMILRPGIPNLAANLKAAIETLKQAIKEANAMQEGNGLPPIRVLFLDTFAKAIAGADENRVSEVQPILNALRALARESGLCIVLVHHSGKDANNGNRGSSAINADMDVNIEIVAHARAKKDYKLANARIGHLYICAPKMREGSKDWAFEFKLESMPLGKNKWGRDVTSAMIVETPRHSSDGSAFGPVEDSETDIDTDDKLGPEQAYNARLALAKKIAAVIDAHGKPLKAHPAKEIKVVDLAEIVPEIKAIRRQHPNNAARYIKKALTGATNEAESIFPGLGRLTYVGNKKGIPWIVSTPEAKNLHG